jgi:periplasmic protein TonB
MIMYDGSIPPLVRKALLLCAAGGMVLTAPVAMAAEQHSPTPTPESELGPEMAAPDPEAEAKPAAPPPSSIPMRQHRAVKPRGNPTLWITENDYPATPHPVAGTTGFTLYVSADGRPTRCIITASSGSRDLDAATCGPLMRRARFDPKLVDGKPVPSTYSNRMIWGPAP